MSEDRLLCQLRHKKPAEAGVGLICSHHAAGLNEALQDILELWALLPLYLLPGQSVDDGSRHLKISAAPAPGSLHVMSLTDRRMHAPRPPGEQLWYQETDDIVDAFGTLVERAAYVAFGRDITNPDLVTITATVRLLRDNRDWIAGQDWISDYAEELRDLRAALTMGSTRNRPVGHCPSLNGDGTECGGPLWPDRNGAMAVDCGTCERHYDERFLSHLGGMMTA